MDNFFLLGESHMNNRKYLKCSRALELLVRTEFIHDVHFAVGETKRGKVYLLTGEGCVVAVRIGRRRGSIDEGLRRRRRRPLLVGRRGVRVMCRVVRRMVAEAACTTQQKAAVTRRRCHIMVVVLVHGPGKGERKIYDVRVGK